ncbi:corticoliberin-1 [Kryptolebias marmoratus]|uniref:Corticoliberin-1-like n=1 Tax=Kryptolebias marmoratus TaxID=37003 RepID=A0A3Q3AUQ6_KRYMA|nr:corticoliberin-1 [Kryptolebias marmoratus]
MKLNVLLWISVLLGSFLPPSADGRPADPPNIPRSLLLHLGEEFSLGGGGGASDLPHSSPPVMIKALLQLQEEEEERKRRKRSDEPPLSLDLTFHLLREVLEMARAEQVAQQVHTNRMMMDSFGK